MARTIENADGMFPRGRVSLGEETPEDIAWQREAICTQFDLNAYLQRMTRAIETLVGDPGTPCADDRQKEARGLALMIDKLPAYLMTGDTSRAALMGIHIGVAAMKIDIMPFEPDVRCGKQMKRGASKSRDKKQAKAEEAHAKICQEFNAAILKRGKAKTPSVTAIRKRIAESIGVSYDTVLRVTKTRK